MSKDTQGTRVYVGGLSESIKKEDLEKEFDKYGKLTSVWVAFNPPGFAFVEFENLNEAEQACDCLNGTEFLGSKLRVEISRRRNSRGRGGFRGSRGGGGSFRGSSGGGFRGRYEGGSRGGGGGFRGGRGSRGGGRGGFERDSYGGGGRSQDRGMREIYGNRESFSGNGGGYGNGGGGGARYRSRSPVARGRY